MVLLVLGVVTAAAGAVMIGFGVPINEFSLGNTLIISGMTALVGGLVVIALSIATRQLMRIAALLNKGQPMPRRGGEGFDQTSSDGSGPSGRMPFPPRPMPDHPRGADTRFSPPPAPPATPSDPIFERLRNVPQPPVSPRPEARQAENPMLSDEEVPLSPRAPRPQAEQPVHDDTMLARVLRGNEARPAARQPEKARNNGAPPPAPVAPASHSRPSFNDVWPESPREEPKADPFASRSDPFARQPEAPAPRPNGDSLRDAIMREEQAHTPVSILKSGVVDGMAYTLYTDGSIEAELAQGVVRFGSIEELRNHLEKSH
jgi:hypothetical protein